MTRESRIRTLTGSPRNWGYDDRSGRGTREGAREIRHHSSIRAAGIYWAGRFHAGRWSGLVQPRTSAKTKEKIKNKKKNIKKTTIKQQKNWVHARHSGRPQSQHRGHAARHRKGVQTRSLRGPLDVSVCTVRGTSYVADYRDNRRVLRYDPYGECVQKAQTSTTSTAMAPRLILAVAVRARGRFTPPMWRIGAAGVSRSLIGETRRMAARGFSCPWRRQ
jgi:hypothetical protein